MAEYEIFREQLAIKYPSYGYALWEPSPTNPNRPVQVGDVGFIREGRFYHLFNALLPADDPSQEFGVPENHEPLVPTLLNHVTTVPLGRNNYCSAGVKVEPDPGHHSSPDDFPQVLFRNVTTRAAAVLSLPVMARHENTLVRNTFGRWMVRHIDTWFAFARNLGLVRQMEEIILVTGRDLTRSWTNIAFLEADAQVSFGAKVEGPDTIVNFQFSPEHAQGAMLHHGPEGTNLPENQCIFIRGFRVARSLRVFPKRLKATASPSSDPGGYDSDLNMELTSIPAVTQSRDPLHLLSDYISEQASDCDKILVHDDDLLMIDGIGRGTVPETLDPDVMMDLFRKSDIKIHKFGCDSFVTESQNAPNTDTSNVKVATLSIPPEFQDHLLHSLVVLCATSLMLAIAAISFVFVFLFKSITPAPGPRRSAGRHATFPEPTHAPSGAMAQRSPAKGAAPSVSLTATPRGPVPPIPDVAEDPLRTLARMCGFLASNIARAWRGEELAATPSLVAYLDPVKEDLERISEMVADKREEERKDIVGGASGDSKEPVAEASYRGPTNQNDPSLLMDGYISHTFGPQLAERHFFHILKSKAISAWFRFERPDCGSFVVNQSWVLDRSVMAIGTVIPQNLWTPTTVADRRQHVQDAELQRPIFFVHTDGRLGLPLEAAVGGRCHTLLNSQSPAPLGPQTTTHIRIGWRGYREFKRQVQIRDETANRNTVTLSKFVQHVARSVEAFLNATQDPSMPDPVDYENPAPGWRIGERGIQSQEIIIIGAIQVSSGGWMPIMQLTRYIF